MSQHTAQSVQKGLDLEIVAGYDRILGGFFLSVQERSAKGEHDFIYDNMGDVELIEFGGQPPDWAYFDERLDQLDVTIPERMRKELLLDQERGTGNRVVYYDGDGNITLDTNPFVPA